MAQVTLQSAVAEVYEGSALANFTLVKSGDIQTGATVFFKTRQLSSEDAAVGECKAKDLRIPVQLQNWSLDYNLATRGLPRTGLICWFCGN